MELKHFLTCCILLITISVKSQVIKIENGISLSSLNMKEPSQYSSFSENMYPYQVAIGVDYFSHKWFDLSSNIGYLVKGGKENEILLVNSAEDEGITGFNLKVKYLTFNTTFNAKYEFSEKTNIYLGIGPRIDIKIKDGYDFKGHPIIEEEKLQPNTVIVGLKTVAGIRHQLNQTLQIGLNFSYLPSFREVYKDLNCKDRTFTLGISLGYKL